MDTLYYNTCNILQAELRQGWKFSVFAFKWKFLRMCPSWPNIKELLMLKLYVYLHYLRSYGNFKIVQECIPVGCVPAAHWPYAGVCFGGGVSASGGCWPLLHGGVWSRGFCLVWGDLSHSGGVWSGGFCSGGGGLSGPRGCLLLGGGGVSGPRGCLLQGMSAQGGVCSRGVWSWARCLLWGVSGPSGGVSGLGLCLVWGVSALGGGVWSWGWYPSMHWGRHPPSCEQNDRPV